MLKNYIQYLKDNPHNYWFKRKLYGWGWTPATWQGWSSLLVYLLSILLLTATVAPRNLSIFLVLVALLTFMLLLLCFKKGESPKWQWGNPTKGTTKT